MSALCPKNLVLLLRSEPLSAGSADGPRPQIRLAPGNCAITTSNPSSRFALIADEDVRVPSIWRSSKSQVDFLGKARFQSPGPPARCIDPMSDKL
jgi:hypothetical protein